MVPLILAAVLTTQSPDVLAEANRRTVKLFGAGGLGRLEAYGSGFVASADGLVVTALSPLLDAEGVTVVTADGDRAVGQVVAIDRRWQLALLQLNRSGLPAFDVDAALRLRPGDVCYAFSNLYKIATGAEPSSVQRGTVAAVAALDARQGFTRLALPGPVAVVDQNFANPGTAGGAVTDHRGRLAGVIGKELKDVRTNTWVNYVVPAAAVADLLERHRSGAGDLADAGRAQRDRPLPRDAPVDWRGMVPLPDVLDEMPAYVDAVVAESPAAVAGVRPDDLLMFVGDVLVRSVADVRRVLATAPADAPLPLVVIRDDELVNLTLPPVGGTQ